MDETSIDDQGRPEPPLDGDELETLVGFLDFQRETLAWKVQGLDRAALARTTAASSMTLGGIVKHLAYVEDDWFVVNVLGEPNPEPWASVDWSADRDWEWHSAPEDEPDELLAIWRTSLARSRDALARALARGEGLGTTTRRSWSDGRSPSLRWVLVHMIEEYARHNGHADLLRESIDGETGE